MARNQWETTGPPEIRGDGNYSYFRPYPPPTADKPIGNLDREPGLDRDERYLVLLFLRCGCEFRTQVDQCDSKSRAFNPRPLQSGAGLGAARRCFRFVARRCECERDRHGEGPTP